MPNEKGGENMSKSRTWGKQALACGAAAVVAVTVAAMLVGQAEARSRDEAVGTLTLAPNSGMWFRAIAWNVDPWTRLQVSARLWDHTPLIIWSRGFVILRQCWRRGVVTNVNLSTNGSDSSFRAGYVTDFRHGLLDEYRWRASYKAHVLGFKCPITIENSGALWVL
jgi:hypothetical protein